MKFGKILSFYLFIYIFIQVSSLKLNLRSNNNLATANNMNNMIDFKDTTNNVQTGKVPVLESVIQAKPTSIISKTNGNTRFKEAESLERSKFQQ